MAGVVEACRACFGTQDLYQVLGLDSNASLNQLKKAYHRVSLRVHPDRVTQDEKQEATRKFQTLGKVYCILADADKRAVYDETGEVDEENVAPEDRDWDQYWRLLFKKITVEDIKNFEDKYRESEEELADLKQAYMDGEGSMDYILENVLCATVDDEARFSKTIDEWIKKKDVPKFDSFTKESKKKKSNRKRKAAAEAEEAAEMKKELGLTDTTDSLQALILARGKKRANDADAFLDSLAAKYGGAAAGRKKGGKKGARK